jgi:hypothetical protein
MYSESLVYDRLPLTASLNEPSLQVTGVIPPLPGTLPPVQSDSPAAMLSLLSARFWPGE